MVVFFLILSLLIAIIAVIFALQNAGVVTVYFFAMQLEGSLALVLLVTFALGVLAGVFLVLPYLVKKSLKNRRLSKELADSIGSRQDEEGLDEDTEVEPEKEFEEF